MGEVLEKGIKLSKTGLKVERNKPLNSKFELWTEYNSVTQGYNHSDFLIMFYSNMVLRVDI